MVGWLAGTITGLGLVVAAWCLFEYLRKRPIQVSHLIGLAVVEVALVAQVVTAFVKIAGGEEPAEKATFIGYLLGSLVILPVGAFLGLGERSKWGSVAAGIACLTIPVVILRMQDLWNGI
jgi:uncharacterized protein YqgC (DUF456 family)